MLKKTDKNPAESRISEIEKEIAELSRQRNKLAAHWNLEKELILSIRELKEEIENLKINADTIERKGDLGKVAELRYGKIPSLEKLLADKTLKLAEIQKNLKMLKEEVDADDIAEIVSKWTGIPVSKMLESERIKLLNMEDNLKKRIIGQDAALESVSNAIRRSRAGLQDENKPIGTFIFLGSTGVGKTELARALAEFLFDDEKAIIRIDMSEYGEKFSVSRLIGAPPGYVGYEEGGQLTESVRRKPYSVVLLDEIEKAHQDTFNILLQVLDEGKLTDSKGKTVSFKNTIIIMTSNLGSNILQEQVLQINDDNRLEIMSEIRIKLLELLKSALKPEFLNRIDEIILFNPLTKSDIRKIVEIQLNYLILKLQRNEISIEFSSEIKDWIGNAGFDPVYGARPLKRIIQKYITNPLSEKLLSGEFIGGDSIIVKSGKRGEPLFEKI